jgi:hyperosmotically inducible protein
MKVKATKRLLLGAGTLVFSVSMVAMPARSQQSAPDNTRTNKDQTTPTADQQKDNSSDRAITQKIRQAVHNDKGLSTYAHNVKIITQGGNVTLRGPVRSEDEKNNVEAKAMSVAGREHVTNQLEVAPSK